MKYPTFSAQYIFVRGRQLEGTYPGDATTGIWPITSNRISRGWGCVTEEDWPYDDSVWPPVEPPGLDERAAKTLDLYYQRVRTLEECKIVLARLQSPVRASLNISEKWYNAPNGRIPECRLDDVPVGSHSVLIHDYDDSRQEFCFQNSWGEHWGDRGFGYIPYTVFESTWVEGWTSQLAAVPMDGNPRTGVVERRSGVFEHGGGVLHCYEFVDSKSGKLAWTFFVERGGFIEVEELFVMPSFRRRGYATRLAKLIADYARERGRSLKAWISHADTAPDNIEVVKKLAGQLGLALSASQIRWASYVASSPDSKATPGTEGIVPPQTLRPSAPRREF